MAENEPKSEKSIEEMKSDLNAEAMSKVLWIVIPMAIGGAFSFFSGFKQEIQLLIWGIMIIIAGFGVWSTNAKKLRKAREQREHERWERQDRQDSERWEKLDKQFAKVDERFDKVDSKMQEQEDKQAEVNRTLLRNELVRMHREWVEEKGYITLEAREYAEKTYMAYNAIPANGSGTKLWKDIEALPIEEHR